MSRYRKRCVFAFLIFSEFCVGRYISIIFINFLQEQRKSKKDPNKLDNDSIKSLLGTMTPRVLGAGGVREVFL